MMFQKVFDVHTHLKFYSCHWFINIKYFHFFSIVKLNVTYAVICRVDNLEADFQQVPLV